MLVFTGLVPVYWSVSNGYPDGLDKLLEQQDVHEKEAAYSAPLAGSQGYGATMQLYVLSGVGGVIVVLGVFFLVGRIIKRSRREDSP